MFGQRRRGGSSEPKLRRSASCRGGLLRQNFLFVSGLSLYLFYLVTIKSPSSVNSGNNANRTGSVRTTGASLSALETLTLTNRRNACHAGLHHLSNNLSISESLEDRNIPRIVHQTSKSRCVTGRVLDATKQWQQALGFSYFLHDDEAIHRLFAFDFPEFPHLNLVSRHCVIHGTLAADLWRYLVLWEYGGIYADLDAVPARFNPATSIESDDDAFFVVEQYHLLSQWFMAVSPRHPLMFYAVHHSLANLLHAKDTGAIPASLYTGPHALHSAYRDFRRDAGVYIDTAEPGNKPVVAGKFTGTHNRTVTVVGVASNQNEVVNRDILKGLKSTEYGKMGMRHFQEDKKLKTGISCLQALLKGAVRRLEGTENRTNKP